MDDSSNPRTAGDERLRRLIEDYFGEGARIRLLRSAPVFGAPLFVVDFDQGPRHYRTLGSIGGFLGEAQVTEQSSMDLLYPAQLVFHYEQLMSLAFALCGRPVRALLLGVGGAAMWRFIHAHLPECAPTLVDADESVVQIARRWFYLRRRVVIDSAEEFLAATTERFDAVLIDLYDSRGPAEMGAAFWARCLDVLAPGGCLATNWADFAANRVVKPMAEAQAELARSRGLDCLYVTRRGFRDNLVQYLPTAPGVGPEGLVAAHAHFLGERRLPRRGRGILEDCLISRGFPVEIG